jgi:hypothetical protein
VVTVTFTVPEPAGETAVIEVADATVKLLAAVVPKSTAVAPVKLVPLTVTVVPPLAGPEVGLIEVTDGATVTGGIETVPTPKTVPVSCDRLGEDTAVIVNDTQAGGPAEYTWPDTLCQAPLVPADGLNQ